MELCMIQNMKYLLMSLFLCLSISDCKPAKLIENKPSITAELTTMYRAIGNKCHDDVSKNFDHLASKLLLPKFRKAIGIERSSCDRILKRVIKNKMYTYYFVNARTKYIDNTLEMALKKNVTQVVNLGSGYDSRAYRFHKKYPRVSYFEIDMPHTINEKKKRIKKIYESLPSFVTYVPVDFNKQSLFLELLKSGYNKNKKTFFIWEGVSMYISYNAFKNVIINVKKYSHKGSMLVFDYFIKDFVTFKIKNQKYAYSSKRAEKIGEPFTLGLTANQCKSLLHKNNLSVIEDIGHKGLYQRYYSTSKNADTARVNPWHRIVLSKMIK